MTNKILKESIKHWEKSINNMRQPELNLNTLYKHYNLTQPKQKLSKNTVLLIQKLASDLFYNNKSLDLENDIIYMDSPVKGRPTKWRKAESIKFYKQVIDIKKQYPTKSMRACVSIIKRRNNMPMNLNSLYSRFKEMRKWVEENPIVLDLVD